MRYYRSFQEGDDINDAFYLDRNGDHIIEVESLPSDAAHEDGYEKGYTAGWEACDREREQAATPATGSQRWKVVSYGKSFVAIQVTAEDREGSLIGTWPKEESDVPQRLCDVHNATRARCRQLLHRADAKANI